MLLRERGPALFAAAGVPRLRCSWVALPVLFSLLLGTRLPPFLDLLYLLDVPEQVLLPTVLDVIVRRGHPSAAIRLQLLWKLWLVLILYDAAALAGGRLRLQSRLARRRERPFPVLRVIAVIGVGVIVLFFLFHHLPIFVLVQLDVQPLSLRG